MKNVQGLMQQTTWPRAPGRDFAGVVEAGPSASIGAKNRGSGGDTGFPRRSHAQRIVVPISDLRRKPQRLDFDRSASGGITFIAT